MDSGLADFIESHADAILDRAVVFARSVKVRTPLDDAALRDHLPDIVTAIVADLRTPQTRAEEVEKSEGRAVAPAGRLRSAAATHALHRAHSGYSISQLVSEYRALRASVLRLRADAPDGAALSAAEMTRFNEAIDEAIAESVSHYAAEVERWRNLFLGVLGQDLRAPLDAILTTSELIARGAVDAPVASAAIRLMRNGERMSELLDKLLVYHRAQMGMGFEIERADVDLVQACRAELDLLQAAMPDNRIRFQSPPSLHGMFDADRIQEALDNLVVNAHKFGASGGEIRVDLSERDASGVELAVCNAGDPIPAEKLDLLFEPLRLGALADGAPEQASLGLGLFVVAQIAKAHGGSIHAESAAGATTFRMRLPRG